MLETRNKKIPVGTENFSEIVKNGYIFCDKTLFIKEFINSGDKLILITRPRRWGKTLNMSMLRHFFEKRVNGQETKDLFKSLLISKERCIDPEDRKEKSYVEAYQGKSPVIYLTLKGIDADDFEDAKDQFKAIIKEVYAQYYDEIQESEKIKDFEKEDFKKKITGNFSNVDLQRSILFLSRLLFTITGKGVYIFIDEYDTPLSNKAYSEQYLEEMTKLLRSFLNATFKTNDHLEKGLLIGILRISKESMLSDLNNLVLYSMIHDGYQKHFGFTEPEVENLVMDLFVEGYEYASLKGEDKNDSGGSSKTISPKEPSPFSESASKEGKEEKRVTEKKAPSLPKLLQDIKEWYNGYRIGDTVLYNPWSIVSYLRDKKIGEYWNETGCETLIKDLMIIKSSIALKKNLKKLIGGESISVSINNHVAFNDLPNNENAVWSFMLFSGYLKVVQVKEDVAKLGGYYECELVAPNKEIKSIYIRYTNEWFSENLQYTTPSEYTQFLESLVKGEVRLFTEKLGGYLLASVSSRNVRGDKQGEMFYHGFCLALLAGLHGTHIVRSDRESGLGFADVYLIPKNTNNTLGIILEFKHVKKGEKTESAVKNALEQINERKYETEFLDYPHIKRIIKIGLAFSEKSVTSAYEITDLKTEGKELTRQDSGIKILQNITTTSEDTDDESEKKEEVSLSKKAAQKTSSDSSSDEEDKKPLVSPSKTISLTKESMGGRRKHDRSSESQSSAENYSKQARIKGPLPPIASLASKSGGSPIHIGVPIPKKSDDSASSFSSFIKNTMDSQK